MIESLEMLHHALNAGNLGLALLVEKTGRLSFVMGQKQICNDVDEIVNCVRLSPCLIEQRDFLMCGNDGKDFLMEFLEKVCLDSLGLLLLLLEQCG